MRHVPITTSLMLMAGLSVALDHPTSVSILETPGSPLLMEEASAGLDGDGHSSVRFTVRNVGRETVSNFHVRVYVYRANDYAAGSMTTSFSGPVAEGQTMSFSAPLKGWFIGPRQRLAAVVSDAQTSSGRWQSVQTKAASKAATIGAQPFAGEWLDRVAEEAPPGCEPGFCASERMACAQMCGLGCVQEFSCSRSQCSSTCRCKDSKACGP